LVIFRNTREIRGVPIYEYEVADGDCRVCGGRFELRRPVDRPPLIQCPLCKKAVRKVISNASIPKFAKPFSVTDARRAGFSVFEKRDKGVYEKL
jgi:putative FmdB family regulatory protein